MPSRRKGGGAPSGLTPDQAREDILEILKVGEAQITDDETTAKYGMKWPFETVVYTHINSDGTVDGELRIIDIPEDVSIREALVVLTENNPFKVIRGLWSSIGIRFGLETGAELKKGYTKHRGLNQESTYYARTNKEVLNFQRAIVQQISENMENAGVPRAQQIYIRLHWNKMNVKPPKRYDRKVRK